MLSAKEFTVGSIGQAGPLSLLLPRDKHDEVILIGRTDDGPVAFFLSGSNQFSAFGSSDNDHWNGLLIPEVHIEVDETDTFNSQHELPPFGSVVRAGTELVAYAKSSSYTSRKKVLVVLEDNLPAASQESVGFLTWQIVIGEGGLKRVLHRISVGDQSRKRG